MLTIRDINPSDAGEWRTLRGALRPGDDAHPVEIAAFFAGSLPEPKHVLLAEVAQIPVGFAELSIARTSRTLPDDRLPTSKGSGSCPRIAPQVLPAGCFGQASTGHVKRRAWRSQVIARSESLSTAAFRFESPRALRLLPATESEPANSSRPQTARLPASGSTHPVRRATSGPPIPRSMIHGPCVRLLRAR